ncbi:MAG: hypothetical protein ACK559_13875, partial [bacterium]
MAGAGNCRSYLLYTLSDLNGLWKEIIIYVNVLGFGCIKKERKKERIFHLYFLPFSGPHVSPPLQPSASTLLTFPVAVRLVEVKKR